MSVPECILEVPYNRVLDRYSTDRRLDYGNVANIISMPMLKAFPTFLALNLILNTIIVHSMLLIL